MFVSLLLTACSGGTLPNPSVTNAHVAYSSVRRPMYITNPGCSGSVTKSAVSSSGSACTGPDIISVALFPTTTLNVTANFTQGPTGQTIVANTTLRAYDVTRTLVQSISFTQSGNVGTSSTVTESIPDTCNLSYVTLTMTQNIPGWFLGSTWQPQETLTQTAEVPIPHAIPSPRPLPTGCKTYCL